MCEHNETIIDEIEMDAPESGETATVDEILVALADVEPGVAARFAEAARRAVAAERGEIEHMRLGMHEDPVLPMADVLAEMGISSVPQEVSAEAGRRLIAAAEARAREAAIEERRDRKKGASGLNKSAVSAALSAAKAIVDDL